MKLQRYPTQADWEEIVALGPGSRMYRGKKTFFYNGEKLWETYGLFGGNPLVYNKEERASWEVIIVLPGVEIIPSNTFFCCQNVKKVIMSDSVKRIEYGGFKRCSSLKFVKLSRNLEYIGGFVFKDCKSLTAIFIPPSCTEIGNCAFYDCINLIIFHVPHTTELGEGVIEDTALFEASPFETRHFRHEEVNTWLKSINNSEGLTLHRICSSDTPNTEQVYRYVKDHGLRAMKLPNSIGITPSQYLAANPYFKIEEGKLVKRYILEMMGEVVQGQT